MSYFVTCTFDLRNATRTDYETAYTETRAHRPRRTVVSNQNRNVVAPTTMTMGEFNGANAAAIRDDIRTRVAAAFRAHRFSSEIFVTVGGQDHTWGSHTT